VMLDSCILCVYLFLLYGFRSSVDDQNDEMTKAGGAVEEGEGKELSSFTPGSPISMPYVPGELNYPTVYPAKLAAFKDAQVKYKAKLCKPLPQSLYSSQIRNLPLCVLS
jgi:hypothetical protein